MAEIKQHVVLVGLMAVGKSSIGKRMAKILDVPFIDIDHAIEQKEGMPITQIFEKHGEAYFRQCERDMLSEVLDRDVPHVIASGGGLFVDEQNRDLVKQKAVSVWISVDIDILVERCSRKNTRPLLLTGDPKEILVGLKEKRYPFYQMADIHVHGDNSPVTQLVSRIVKLVKENQ